MNWCHSGNLGDIILSLPLVRAAGGGNLYLRLNVQADYPIGTYHPCGSVRLNREMADMLIPLLAAQEYLDTVKVWEGEAIDNDLDCFRELPGLDYTKGQIARWYSYAFPRWPVDLSSPWLTCPRIECGSPIVVNRTFRYRNAVDYSCLAGESCLFIGLEDEYEDFRKRFFSCPYHRPRDLLEAAGIIAGSRYFVGNQSACWTIAEAIKHKRLLEVCPSCPNNLPLGPNGWDAFTRSGFTAVNRLLCVSRR